MNLSNKENIFISICKKQKKTNGFSPSVMCGAPLMVGHSPKGCDTPASVRGGHIWESGRLGIRQVINTKHHINDTAFL